jgi:hypothetical protein
VSSLAPVDWLPQQFGYLKGRQGERYDLPLPKPPSAKEFGFPVRQTPANYRKKATACLN